MAQSLSAELRIPPRLGIALVKGRVWALDLPANVARDVPIARSRLLGQWRRLFSTFGRDGAGELYLGDFGAGEIVQVLSGATR